MTAPRKNGPKTRGKPFESGNPGRFQPGNPGRPRGSRHRTTLAIESLLEGQHEALTQKAIDKALEGDTVALRLCLDRLAPARRDTPITFDLAPISSVGDAVAASSNLLAAVAAGEVTPDEGGRVMALLTAHRAIVETCDLEQRIRNLEERPQ